MIVVLLFISNILQYNMFNQATSFHQDLSSWTNTALTASAFCGGGAVCDQASTSPPTSPKPTSSPTNYPTSSPTNTPTTSVPAEFTLPPPDCTIDTSDTDSVGDVTCIFTGIVSPNDATVSMSVKAFSDCLSPYVPSSFGSTTVTKDTPDETGVTSFEAVANVDPTSEYAGELKFCIRADLIETSSSEKMVFRSEQIKINFSYDGTFSVVGFSTTEFVGIGDDVTATTKNLGAVTATICDSLGATLSNPPPLSLETNLFVCINTDVVGMKIPSITSFIAQKSSAGDDYNIAAANPNVVVRGLDTANVKVIMRLPARFFRDSSNIILSGAVEVDLDNRRRLQSPRALATESDAFRLVVEVSDEDDDDSSASGLMIMSSVILFVATMLFI